MASLVPGNRNWKSFKYPHLSSGSIYTNVHMDKPTNLQSLIIIKDFSLIKKFTNQKIEGLTKLLLAKLFVFKTESTVIS